MNLWKRRDLLIGCVIFVLFVVIVIYVNFFMGWVRFKEEVELENQDIIVIDRRVKTNSYGEVGGPGGWEVKYNSLEVVTAQRTDLPGKWESEKSLLPILLDFDAAKKEWFIISVISNCRDKALVSYRDFYYTEDRYRNGSWVRVPLSSGMIGRRANVLFGIRSSGETSVGLLDKFERMNKNTVVKEFVEVRKTEYAC